MPFAQVNQTRLYYRLEGTSGRPVLVLSHSIGTDHGMWEPQMPDVLRYFEVLRYDTRGHGASEVSPGEYSIAQLGQDALALLDHLGVTRFAWCGLSMGGAIGQWVAIHAPERLTTLVLANTSARLGDRAMWEARIEKVRAGGMASIVDVALQRFFSKDALGRADGCVSSIRSVLLGTDPSGYINCCAALRDFDGSMQLGNIAVPTLIVAGEHDVSTPWKGNGETLAREIRGSKYVRLPTAHLSNLERPRSFTAALLEFLLSDERPSIERGFAARRRVLGDAHVTQSIAAATDFTRDFQDLITRYAWGEVWSRPLLDDRTRRLIVLSVMAATGRWEEFRMHFVAAVSHTGLEVCDLKEVLLIVALYAGLPAANTAFRLIQDELAKTAGSGNIL